VAAELAHAETELAKKRKREDTIREKEAGKASKISEQLAKVGPDTHTSNHISIISLLANRVPAHVRSLFELI